MQVPNSVRSATKHSTLLPSVEVQGFSLGEGVTCFEPASKENHFESASSSSGFPEFCNTLPPKSLGNSGTHSLGCKNPWFMIAYTHTLGTMPVFAVFGSCWMAGRHKTSESQWLGHCHCFRSTANFVKDALSRLLLCQFASLGRAVLQRRRSLTRWPTQQPWIACTMVMCPCCHIIAAASLDTAVIGERKDICVRYGRADVSQMPCFLFGLSEWVWLCVWVVQLIDGTVVQRNQFGLKTGSWLIMIYYDYDWWICWRIKCFLTCLIQVTVEWVGWLLGALVRCLFPLQTLRDSRHRCHEIVCLQRCSKWRAPLLRPKGTRCSGTSKGSVFDRHGGWRWWFKAAIARCSSAWTTKSRAQTQGNLWPFARHLDTGYQTHHSQCSGWHAEELASLHMVHSFFSWTQQWFSFDAVFPNRAGPWVLWTLHWNCDSDSGLLFNHGFWMQSVLVLFWHGFGFRRWSSLS